MLRRTIDAGNEGYKRIRFDCLVRHSFRHVYRKPICKFVGSQSFQPMPCVRAVLRSMVVLLQQQEEGGRNFLALIKVEATADP